MSNNKRLFISINCDDEVRSHLLSVQEKIKSQTTSGNFTRPENLHLTLIFIGETKEEEITLIESVIVDVIQRHNQSFNLTLSKVNCFKNFNRELWWISVDHSDPYFSNLKNIRQKIADGLSDKNIIFDNKPFKAHITLAREIRFDKPIVFPDQKINFPVKRISLMKSERTNGLLVYTEIFGRFNQSHS